jgi:riboflavin biosynthesis RibT protein
MGMFYDMKEDLENPTVRKLMGESMWDSSTEAIDKRAAEFRHRDDWNLYGWRVGNEILGICGLEVHPDCVVLHGMAVDPNSRKNGIGKAMITAIQQKYKKTVQAETDDSAAEFYRKCGFETEGFVKTYNGVEWQRYKCVLHYN